MKTVTVEEFLKFNPCYDENEIRRIAGDKTKWSALDILRLADVPARDKLWAVLREDFIEASILHEFACRYAEQALALVENPDPRSIAAKRAWVRGEITDDELENAYNAARDAARDAADATGAAWAAWGIRDKQVETLIEMLEAGK